MVGHAHEEIEATSLLGQPLQRPVFPDDIRERLAEQLAEAKATYASAPENAEAILLLGQRAGAIGHLRDAIRVFTDGIARHPGDARIYRYRGHRLINTRQFDRAVQDLSEAVRLVEGRAPEPEIPIGAPAGTPATYMLQFSIWYHLGLANYLRGDFAAACAAYHACTAFAPTDETMVAITHWYYMALRRLGATEDATRVLAPIHPHMAIIENRPYYRLTLLYTGELTPEEALAPNAEDTDKGMGNNRALMDAIVGYGVANWHRYNGHRAEADALCRQIIDSTPPSMAQFAFGYIAAEADLARE